VWRSIFRRFNLTLVLQALTLGIIVGGIFALFRLNVPAPSTLAGIMGVVGLWFGWVAVGKIMEHLGR
jgi:XapX domain-containing protein